jgi:O-antigen/teichoic acid export membrane protein
MAAAALVLGVTLLVGALGASRVVWPNQESTAIALAAVLAIVLWMQGIAEKMVDGAGLSVAGEVTRLLHRALSVGTIAVLFLSGLLHSLSTFLLVQLLLASALLLLWQSVLLAAGKSLHPKTDVPRSIVRRYAAEFWSYSHPLVVYSFVGMLAGIGDRWLLEKFAGSREQGVYGLAYQIGSVCFVFSGAMAPLLAREFARAHQQQDPERMRADFQRYIPRFYAIAGFFGVFMAVQAEKLISIFGGAQFAGAVAPVALMCFYPLHQTYGQLSGSVFYATGQTRLYRNIGLATMITGLITTFFLIAPANLSGLELAALGLAIKMVAIQVISVNLQLWFNSRTLGLSFGHLLAHQVWTVVAFAAAAWGAVTFTDRLVQTWWVAFLASGLLYTLAIGGITFLLPELFALRRDELRQEVRALAERWRIRRS